MRQITEQQILALAPNPAAVTNGRKISQKGGFVRLSCSADDSFYLGECTGSGKSNYITTADFLDPANPVFRCSCPSRQFPCKHSLALMFEMLGGKPFETCDVPEDILEKRAKKQVRTEKAQAVENGEPAPAPKVNKAARTKKLKKQIEGLELTAKLVGDLMSVGLGAMGGTTLNTYRQLAKQLGDYYLPGPQRQLNRLILEIAAFQKDGSNQHYESAIEVLERLQALVKKSRKYLEEKLANGDVDQDDNLLYEELGGVWKLSELAELGLCKQNAQLMQLSFWVCYDEAREEYIDTGCWVDLETGEISLTQNYRPLKALKYVKQEDSTFGVAKVPLACYYPGEGNRRVRWEGMELLSASAKDHAKLCSFSGSLAPAVKEAKNLLKNTLAEPLVFKLIRYAKIGKAGDQLALEDESGATILLGHRDGMEDTVMRIETLPDPKLLSNQVLLGAFYYDKTDRRIRLQPLSILTETAIVRLLY